MNFNRTFNGLFVVMLLTGTAWLAGCEGFGEVGDGPMTANPRNAVIDAVATLRQAAESTDPIIHADAIEALASTVGDKEGGLYLQALSDASPVVQFAGAMAVGDVKYAPAREKLSQMADQAGPDKRVYAAVIYALYRLGETSHMPDMVRLLQHRESEVRADAVMVLGKMGEPSAIYPLRVVLADERDSRVELNIVEALALLGEGDSSARLERYSRQRFFDQQLVIIPLIARVRPERGKTLLSDMMTPNQPITVRVAAAGALARFGDKSLANYRLCMVAARNPEGLLETAYGKGHPVNAIEQATLRKIGILALGQMGRIGAVDALLPMLNDPDGGVRVAAAASILRLLPGFLFPESQATEVKVPGATAPAAASQPATEPAASQPATEPAASQPTTEPMASRPATEPTASQPTTAAREPDASASRPAEPAVVMPRQKLRSAGAKD